MRNAVSFRRLGAIAASLLVACSGAHINMSPNPDTPPPIQREMRGLWVTTVGNTDWPSSRTLSADQQRAELVSLIDRAQALGFNALMFHVRPAADAVYRSDLEPWAALLTGKQGTDPGYDPLALAVELAHARGLEIHAWINPYRAGNTKDSANLSSTHIFNTRRDLVRVYGSQLWQDPGEPEVLDRAMQVVRDLVTRYDIDGVHADDYFYPYREKDSSGVDIAFPDSASYARSGSTLSLDDWRRDNVDRFIQRMYGEVHALKPGVKVGISPFGIWRPGNPPTVVGLDAYQSIYADSKKWLQSGWVDYLVPQLYWAIASPGQSYPKLLDWWLSQNTLNRHIWPGLATYRVNSGTATSFSATEIPEQIALTRSRPGGTGEIFFNTTTTFRIASSLAQFYSTPALIPAFPWLGNTAPGLPQMTTGSGVMQLIASPEVAVRWWVVRQRSNGKWTTQILFGEQRTLRLAADTDRILVNAVDRFGNISPEASWPK